MNDETKLPYQSLGKRLRAVRQKLQESVPDVCGAVEIDAELLEQIEKGAARPTEDILQLLINHFDLHDQADNLWKLAGYDAPQCDHDHDHDSEDITQNRNQPAMMIMAVDPRILYSDQVQVNANRNGVVLNFTQRANAPQPLMAARVGMSREQAQDVANIIQEALQRSEPGRLPRSKNDKPDQSEPNKK